ncbi:hypothetical protein [Cupriavidus yeoncheonensis]|uniref:hypothetical protein n=1 Tax=Cupriavidus yeoncheonensis TaxID=1462994 RepID=UPI001BAE30F8|nr:hypothetical protein [Cupriavidus yeoncheonensis]
MAAQQQTTDVLSLITFIASSANAKARFMGKQLTTEFTDSQQVPISASSRLFPLTAVQESDNRLAVLLDV